MLVYRVEDDNGGGPHIKHQLGIYLNASSQPEPLDDGIFEWDRGHSCGFDCMDKLHAWFNVPDRRVMHERGLKVSTYFVPSGHVLFGNKQIMFRKAHAIVVERKPLL